jgi:BlaI family penicillinase repressor
MNETDDNSLMKGERIMQSENIKLFDSELKVMDILWKEGIVPAKYVADRLTQELGWNKNTTYTLIKRCMKKGAIERTEPNFMCHALIAKEDVQETETNELINKIYDGSVDKLFAALLGRKKLSAEQIEKLKQIVDSLE